MTTISFIFYDDTGNDNYTTLVRRIFGNIFVRQLESLEMKIAHVVIAHKNPEQLVRLVQRLSHPDCDFFIHIDRKVSAEPFYQALENQRVHFIKNRRVCNWGGYSLTQTIVSCMQEVLQSGKPYNFLNLLSAQDYPLMSADKIHAFFGERLGYSFINYEASDTDWFKLAKVRYERYHFTDYGFRGKYAMQWIINALTPKRKFPSEMDFYGGSKGTWWTLSDACAAYIVNEYKNRSRFFRFIKYSWGSDEFVIPTLVMNSSYREKAINENYRYIDWSEGNASPKLLGMEDLDKLSAQHMLYARKFDISVDERILDKIDEQLIYV